MAYICPKCGNYIPEPDHPLKHHPACPIANLAKKDKEGYFAKDNPSQES